MRKLVPGVAVALAALALAALAEPFPLTKTCTSLSTTCSGSTGVCEGSVPDAGITTGMPLTGVRSYYWYSCPPRGQAITAAGSWANYHARAGNGRTAEVQDNAKTQSTATTNPGVPAGGIGTGYGGCTEAASYTVPYHDTTGDRMYWIPVGITVSPTDGGTLTTYICPAR